MRGMRMRKKAALDGLPGMPTGSGCEESQVHVLQASAVEILSGRAGIFDRPGKKHRD